MPIPTQGAWPPKHVARAYSAYREYDAWYGGESERLREVYGGLGPGALPPSQRTRPGQLAGGIVGTISRWLWGTPAPASTRDTRFHVPLPADLAAVSANLLFAEPPKLTHENAETQAFLERLNGDGLPRFLLHAAEPCSVLGDVYLRPVVDKDVLADRAIMTAVHADGAVPVFRWGKLIEVTFWSTLHEDGNEVWRLLEHHDVLNGAGRITYALHKGTKQELGPVRPLADHPNSEHLAVLVDASGVQETKLKRLDVVRIENAGPQRPWRTDGSLKYYGRSDFQGNLPIFDQIDEAWTSWMRDLRLAKGRISVPEYMLSDNGPGLGSAWDPDREVYSALTTLAGKDSSLSAQLTMTQFEIRHVEHKATIDALIEVAMRHAGFSSQTLGEEGETPITATEAQNRERMTFTTKGNREQTWGVGIPDYVEIHMETERAHFNLSVTPVKPNIEFGNSVSESPETLARTIQLLDAAGAISTKTKVEMQHPDWDKLQVADEVKLILRERESIAISDPGAELGPPGGNNPPDGSPAA